MSYQSPLLALVRAWYTNSDLSPNALKSKKGGEDVTNRNGVIKAFVELVGDAEDQIKRRMIMAAYEVLQNDAPQLADEVVLRGVQALSESDEGPKALVLWLFEADRNQQTILIEKGAPFVEVDPLKRWSVAFDAHPEVAESLKDEIALIVKRTRVVPSRKVRRG